MKHEFSKGRPYRPYANESEKEFGDRVMIHNLRVERDMLLKQNDDQFREICFLRGQVNGYSFFISEQARKERIKHG